MQYVFTGLVHYDHTDDTKVAPGRMTIRDDKVILWLYDYEGNKTVVSLPRKEESKTYYDRRMDTSGQYFEIWSEWTSEYAWDKWANGMALGEYAIQTWDRHKINVKVKRIVKKEMVTTWCDDFELDEKSRTLFSQYMDIVV